MAVYFKFNSWNQSHFDTISLDLSPMISVGELKQLISKKKKLEKNTGLVLTNAQTGEEYKEDTQFVAKNTSIIVRLVPPQLNITPIASHSNGTVQSNASKPITKSEEEDEFGPAFWDSAKSTSSSTTKSTSSASSTSAVTSLSSTNVPSQNVAPLARTLVTASVPSTTTLNVNVHTPQQQQTQQQQTQKPTTKNPETEEDKILAVINGAADIPAPNTTSFRPNMRNQGRGAIPDGPKRIPPAGYVCFRCGNPGHFIYECPTNGDPSYNVQRRPQTMHGVPKSFLEQGGKGLEFKPNEMEFNKLISVSGLTKDIKPKQIPSNLICPLCKELYRNAVLLSCCMESACDDCIRTSLIEKNNLHCPLCHSPSSPDQLLPNKALRRAVDAFRSGQSPPSPPPTDSSTPTSTLTTDTNQDIVNTSTADPQSEPSSLSTFDASKQPTNNNNAITPTTPPPTNTDSMQTTPTSQSEGTTNTQQQQQQQATAEVNTTTEQTNKKSETQEAGVETRAVSSSSSNSSSSGTKRKSDQAPSSTEEIWKKSRSAKRNKERNTSSGSRYEYGHSSMPMFPFSFLPSYASMMNYGMPLMSKEEFLAFQEQHKYRDRHHSSDADSKKRKRDPRDSHSKDRDSSRHKDSKDSKNTKDSKDSDHKEHDGTTNNNNNNDSSTNQLNGNTEPSTKDAQQALECTDKHKYKDRESSRDRDSKDKHKHKDSSSSSSKSHKDKHKDKDRDRRDKKDKERRSKKEKEHKDKSHSSSKHRREKSEHSHHSH